jgi:hypothetical protein
MQKPQGDSEPSRDGGSASLSLASVAASVAATLSRRFGGLRNARQGCYANAVMQQLAVAKGFRDFLLLC